MRAVVLGAGGAIGQEVARGVAASGAFDDVLLADLDPRPIRRMARDLGRSVRADRLDAGDGRALRNAVRRNDVIVNCTGYRLGVEVLRAAIARRASYLDLGGLYNTPRQLELDDRARHAGITAVLGCGATPGLSNVLVRAAAERMDHVDEVHIAFASHRDLAPSPGLLDTILDEFRPDVARFTWTRGKLRPVGPFEGARTVRFPPPLGAQEVYLVPHSETYTLPRSLPGVREVSVRGTWRPSDMQRLRALADLGLTSEDPVRVNGHSVRPLDVVRSVLLGRDPEAADATWAFYLHVDVRGRVGRARRTSVRRAAHPREWGEASTVRMTAVPAIVGATMVARGEVRDTGVLAPEEAFPPGPFLDDVARAGIRVGP